LPIEGKHAIQGWDFGAKRFAFGPDAGRRGCGFGLRHFDHVDGRQAERPAGSLGAAAVMRKQLAFRPPFQLADGSDQEPHACSL
jgi:hypothetical protein